MRKEKKKRVCPRTSVGLKRRPYTAVANRVFGISATERRSLGATVPQKKIEKLKKTIRNTGVALCLRAAACSCPLNPATPVTRQLHVRTFLSTPPLTPLWTLHGRVSVFIFIRLQLRAATARRTGRGPPAPAVVQVSRFSCIPSMRPLVSPSPDCLRPSQFLTRTENRATRRSDTRSEVPLN